LLLIVAVVVERFQLSNLREETFESSQRTNTSATAFDDNDIGVTTTMCAKPNKTKKKQMK